MPLSTGRPEHHVQFYAFPTSPQIAQDPARWGTTLDITADVPEDHRADAVIAGVYINGVSRNFTRWPDRLNAPLAVWVAPRIPFEAARVRVVYSLPLALPSKAPHSPPAAFPEHIQAHACPPIHYGLQART